MSNAGGRILLLSDVKLADSGGRAERFETRTAYLEKHGWDIIIGHVSEPYIRGAPRAVIELTRLARREDVDVVNSVNNPFHLHVIGFLVSLFARTMWLAEFRDPLVTNPSLENDSLGPLRKFVEWFAVHVADHVVWGDGIQVPDGYFEETYPRSADNVTRLPFAGYEADRFESATPREYEDFTITYAGSFYEGWIEPYNFLRGLARYVEQREDGQRGLTVQFYGDWHEDYQREAEQVDVTPCIEHHEFVPHEAIVPVLKGSDALLYIGGTDPQNRRNVPSKIMDYIGARRPILVLADESFRVVELIRQYNLGLAADPREPQAIADALERLESNEFDFTDDPDVFDHFTRERKNEHILEILETRFT
jgi:glycosyltransferase involved in cell wall biosynthesis